MRFPSDANLPADLAHIMGHLEPASLQIQRDELFFQAGFAAGEAGAAGSSSSLSSRERAGVRGPSTPLIRRFWHAVAAALLLVSIGLGVALNQQTGTVHSLQTALAAIEPTAPAAAQSNLSPPPTLTAHNDDDSAVFGPQSRNWQRLASAATLPPGRLTAMGWEALPPEAVQAESASENAPTNSSPHRSSKPDAAPHRPATYGELMRQLEG